MAKETLLEKQFKFAKMVSVLLTHIFWENYKVTFGDAYRPENATYGHPKSLHKKRLAIDLNFFRNGKYITDTEELKMIGEYWESIGGTWGGRFGDGNHFSLEYEGMK